MGFELVTFKIEVVSNLEIIVKLLMKKKIFNFQDFQATAMTKTISSGSQKVKEEAYPQIFLFWKN